ncbi:DUF2382 domain-containing protein [Belnapia moabensis]|uniref:DUF2382 domain-containing protein n=1 Tax=Belnapia moabensis TaxID=365533 RepID=UPI001B80A9A8|nr:DUF2382 domain-containing protein [Belnapia moabensis]
MTLRTLMLAGPAKLNELFAKLAETSDGAVKTREKLFTELKAELEQHTNLEEQHLFPVLRRNPETKGLVAGAIKDNKELRAKLAELDALPKADEAFPERLKELQKTFRQHARDEKTELLPAIQRALSEEQVQGVAERMEAGLAEAEQARQDEAEERRITARQEREEAEFLTRQAELHAEQSQAADTRTEEAARRVADTAMRPIEAATETTQQVTRMATGNAGASGDTDRRSPARAAAPLLTSMFFWPWAGPMQGRQQAGSAVATRGPFSMEEVIPLGEEVLEVGKRTENRGTTRIHRYVVQTPVEQQVTLQSERVVVERRRPMSDRVTGEVLTEVTVEVVETAEVPVVEKRTRLREEIVVRTERTQRVETVRETVRRDEVDIRQPGKARSDQQLRHVTAER